MSNLVNNQHTSTRSITDLGGDIFNVQIQLEEESGSVDVKSELFDVRNNRLCELNIMG